MTKPTISRLGSLITFLGAMGMFVVASKWPHDGDRRVSGSGGYVRRYPYGAVEMTNKTVEELRGMLSAATATIDALRADHAAATERLTREATALARRFDRMSASFGLSSHPHARDAAAVLRGAADELRALCNERERSR